MIFCSSVGFNRCLPLFSTSSFLRRTLRFHDVLGLYVCEDVNNDVMVDHHGVPAYVAPEVLRRVPIEYAGKPADIWALGVLLYYLLFSR